jgi:hypothetical protein
MVFDDLLQPAENEGDGSQGRQKPGLVSAFFCGLHRFSVPRHFNMW